METSSPDAAPLSLKHRTQRAGPIVVTFAVVAALSCSHLRSPAPARSGDHRTLPAMSGADRRLVSDVRNMGESRAAEGTFAGVVLVASDDDTLFESAYGLADRSTNRPNLLSTCFDIASLGKMFTSVAVAQLVERHRLEFDQPVGRYLPPSLAATEIGRRVTIHQLLTHTSGVPDLPDDIFNAPPARLSGYTSFFQTRKLEFEPGSNRAYSNAGYILLGIIIEHVSGQDYEEYVREHVFRPAGMSVGFRRKDCSSGVAVGYSRKGPGDDWQPNTSTIASTGGPHGGALTTARDLVKFFRALRAGRLLKPEMALRVTTPPDGAVSAYGFGVLSFDTDRLVGHSGGNVGVSADAYTYWSSGYTVIVLSNLEPPASHEVAGAIRKWLEPRFTTQTSSPPANEEARRSGPLRKASLLPWPRVLRLARRTS